MGDSDCLRTKLIKLSAGPPCATISKCDSKRKGALFINTLWRTQALLVADLALSQMRK